MTDAGADRSDTGTAWTDWMARFYAVLLVLTGLYLLYALLEVLGVV